MSGASRSRAALRYLLARIRKYGAKMKESGGEMGEAEIYLSRETAEEMAPGQLEYDEIMEPEAGVAAGDCSWSSRSAQG